MMKRITRIIRPIICMAVLLFAMTTAVMGCYQKETEPIDIPGRTPSGTSAPQPSATPAGEVIPSVDRQAELAEARAENPDTVAWLYIPGAEVDDPVMQAEDNGYYLKLDENGEPYAEHLPEPRPRVLAPHAAGWGLVFKGMLQEAGA